MTSHNLNILIILTIILININNYFKINNTFLSLNVSALNIEWDYTETTPPLNYLIRVTDLNENTLFNYNTEDNSDLLLQANIIKISDLTLGQFYKFYISSYDENGNYSEESNPLIAQECEKPLYFIDPAFPNIVGEVISDDEIRILYDPPDSLGGCSIEKYIIYFSEGDSNDLVNQLEIYDLDNLSTIITIADAVNNQGKIYTFQIEAYNPAASTKTETISIILGRTPIDQPPIIEINESESTEDTICLIIPTLTVSNYNSGNLPIISYEIVVKFLNTDYYFSGSPPNYNTSTSVCLENNSNIVNTNTNTVSLISLALGRTYIFKFRVWNVLGYSDYSETTSYLLSIPPETPKQPILKSQTATEIILSLNSALVYTGLGVTTVLLGSLGPSNSEIELTSFSEYSKTFSITKSDYSLVNNKIYYFRLHSYNSKGTSEYSSSLSVKTLVNFSEISNIKIESFDYSSNLISISFDVSYLSETNIIGYKVFFDNKGNNEFKQIGIINNKDINSYIFDVNNYNSSDSDDEDIEIELGQKYNIKIESTSIDLTTVNSIKLFEFCDVVDSFNSLSLVSNSISKMKIKWKYPDNMGGCEIFNLVLIKNYSGSETETVLSRYQLNYEVLWDSSDYGNSYDFSIRAENSMFSKVSNILTVIVPTI